MIQDNHLRDLQREAEEASASAVRLVAGLTEQQLAWSPAPDAWSIGHCLDHLAISGQQYAARLRPAIEKAREGGGPVAKKPYRPSWFGRKFIDWMRPDARRKFKVPNVFRPPAVPDPGAADRFLASQRELGELLERADGLDLNRIKIRSPVTPLLRFSIGEAFSILVVHAQDICNKRGEFGSIPSFRNVLAADKRR